MAMTLKKKLDNTPKAVYNIHRKDREGFYTSPIAKVPLERNDVHNLKEFNAYESTLPLRYVK
jgi:hypothetical protein